MQSVTVTVEPDGRFRIPKDFLYDENGLPK